MSKLATFISNVMDFSTNVSAYIKLFQTHYNTRRIAIGGIVFDWAKKPSNNTNALVVGEVISNGRISNSVHVYSAVYAGGDIANFGTLANNYSDGSYTDVNYQEF